MEHPLICNNLRCRTEIRGEALVTTCSHIFCPECAEKYGFEKATGRRAQACPACGVHLRGPSDAMFTTLNPSEEFKTSVLSGFSPNVVMECAGRALSFWAHQMSQDVCYKQYLYESLNNKYSDLLIKYEKAINDSNIEVNKLQVKLSKTIAESEKLRRKNSELVEAYKDKARKLLQVQELYDRIKSKVENSQIQQAASEAVDLHISRVGYENERSNNSFRNIDKGYLQELSFPNPNRPSDLVCSARTSIPHSNVQQPGDLGQLSKSMVPSRNQTSQTLIGSTMRQRPHHQPSLDTTGQQGIPMTYASRFNTSRPIHGVASPGFTDCRASVSSTGLAPGLKVGQQASIRGLEASIRSEQ